MKKILLLTICLFLLIVSPLYAKTTINIIGGGTPSPCPPFYADTNVFWSWDGNYDDGTPDHNAACNSSGTKINDSTDSAVTSTSYGEGSGDIGMIVDGASDYISWAQTANQYFDGDAAQTVCARILVATGGVDYRTPLFIADDWGSNSMRMYHEDTGTGDKLRVWYFVNGSPDPSLNSTNDVPQNSFKTVGISYKDATTSTGDISVNPGDNGTWDSGWNSSADGITTAQDAGPTRITVGNYLGAGPTSGSIYITAVAGVSEWEFDCSTLTGNW